MFALGIAFHAFAVLEVYLVLGWLMGDGRPTWTQSIVFEALNRAITIAFKFVPFRVGVDEALSGALAPALAMASANGVTLAVVRKVRNLFWAGVGLALIGAHRVQRDGQRRISPELDARVGADGVGAARVADGGPGGRSQPVTLGRRHRLHQVVQYSFDLFGLGGLIQRDQAQVGARVAGERLDFVTERHFGVFGALEPRQRFAFVQLQFGDRRSPSARRHRRAAAR